MDISIERLRELLEYDPLTGIFTWKRRPVRAHYARCDNTWNSRFAGRHVTTNKHPYGYQKIGIKGIGNLYAHRTGWAMHHGYWPTFLIDHENGDPTDNRISNLREATNLENSRNMRTRKDSLSGHKGVTWNKRSNKWVASIFVKGKNLYLGIFSEKSDAVAARKDASAKIFGEFDSYRPAP